MSKKLAVFALVLCAALAIQTGAVQAEEATTTNTTTTTTTKSISSNLDLLQSLMAQIEVLQKKLAELRGQAIAVQHELRAGLREGATGEDVKKIQELLATDPTLYPEGLSTGFFGPLTREALKRFQHRHELTVTGAMDEDTRELLEEYLAEKGNGLIPPGFLRAPGIIKKIEMRFVEDCENRGEGKGAFCNKLKLKWKMEHTDDEGEEDNDKDDNDELEIEADVRTNDTRVVIEFPNDTKRIIEVNSTDEEEVIDAIVEKTELTEEEVRAAIVFDDKDNGDDGDEGKSEDADDAVDNAEKAIAEAEAVIDALESAIDDTATGSAKTTASTALEDVRETLEAANDALDDGDEQGAEELAEEAEHNAKDAYEDLTGEEFEESDANEDNT